MMVPGRAQRIDDWRNAGWDRGDLCPWYTDCQQLRDETRSDSCTCTMHSIVVGRCTDVLVLYYTTSISMAMATTIHVPCDQDASHHDHRDLTLHYQHQIRRPCEPTAALARVHVGSLLTRETAPGAPRRWHLDEPRSSDRRYPRPDP